MADTKAKRGRRPASADTEDVLYKEPITGESLRAVLAKSQALGEIARDIGPEAFERAATQLKAARESVSGFRLNDGWRNGRQHYADELGKFLGFLRTCDGDVPKLIPSPSLIAEVERELELVQADLEMNACFWQTPTAGQPKHRTNWQEMVADLCKVFDTLVAPRQLGHTTTARIKFIAAATKLVTGENPTEGVIKGRLVNDPRVKGSF